MNPFHALWTRLFWWIAPLLVTAPENQVQCQETFPTDPLRLPPISGGENERVRQSAVGSATFPGIAGGGAAPAAWVRVRADDTG